MAGNNMLHLNLSKRWSHRHYLVCPNPQTCDDAFEWVEPRESDFERKEQEAVSGGKGKEMGNNQDSDGDYEEELQDDLRGFVPPACDLFNEARWRIS